MRFVIGLYKELEGRENTVIIDQDKIPITGAIDRVNQVICRHNEATDARKVQMKRKDKHDIENAQQQTEKTTKQTAECVVQKYNVDRNICHEMKRNEISYIVRWY